MRVALSLSVAIVWMIVGTELATEESANDDST